MEYTIQLRRDGFTIGKPDADEGKIYFEDLPANAQEAIIDLIVSIMKNKKRDRQ
jgi:hypothetical protein